MVFAKTKRATITCFFYLLVLVEFVACDGQNHPKNEDRRQVVPPTNVQEEVNAHAQLGTIATIPDKNIRCIFQDSHDNNWFGTNGAGVYRYDGKRLVQFTEKDGLSNNQVLSIQEDEYGNMWFGTGVFGVCKFDRQSFTTLTTTENQTLSKGSDEDWKKEPNDMWFNAGGGVFRFNASSLTYLPLEVSNLKSNQMEGSPYTLSRYAVYSILKDSKGNVWFGTQAEGVCRYDGKSLTWFKEKGLAGPAVLGIFEDSKGNMWFGNNGAGLFRYDGNTLTNFTAEKGLHNNDFRVSGKSEIGTLARVYAINEDTSGSIWVGTVDAGVWKIQGDQLTQYSTKEGLTSNAINTIYKDKKGELWFGTDANGICKFNGVKFSEMILD